MSGANSNPAGDRFAHCIVLRLASHRARDRSGVTRKGTAYYSFRRGSVGGYYAVPEDVGEGILERKIPGVSRLKGPYEDLLMCWPAGTTTALNAQRKKGVESE